MEVTPWQILQLTRGILTMLPRRVTKEILAKKGMEVVDVHALKDKPRVHYNLGEVDEV